MFSTEKYNSGLQAPVEKYDLSVLDLFPRTGKQYMIESSIDSRYSRDYISTNGNMYDSKITENFIEWLIPGANNEFIDFASFAAEIKIRILNEDGSALDAAANVSVVDGLFHRLFQSHAIFLNGIQTESSIYFGLFNNIKNYLNMDKDMLGGIGANMMYKDIETPIVNIIDDGYLANNDKIVSNACKSLMHLTGPLLFDMSETDAYLLDNVDVRIRLELASPSVIILSPDKKKYKYTIEMCKLMVKKIIPVPSALLSLNQSLENNKYIEYLFDRPIHRMIVFPKDQAMLNIENPFNGVIPHKIIVFIIDQDAINGAYEKIRIFYLIMIYPIFH